jgi:hypothetical protein
MTDMHQLREPMVIVPELPEEFLRAANATPHVEGNYTNRGEPAGKQLLATTPGNVSAPIKETL